MYVCMHVCMYAFGYVLIWHIRVVIQAPIESSINLGSSMGVMKRLASTKAAPKSMAVCLRKVACHFPCVIYVWLHVYVSVWISAYVRVERMWVFVLIGNKERNSFMLLYVCMYLRRLRKQQRDRMVRKDLPLAGGNFHSLYLVLYSICRPTWDADCDRRRELYLIYRNDLICFPYAFAVTTRMPLEHTSSWGMFFF